MAEMSRENARQLFVSGPPEAHTRILFEYKAKGESVFIDINGHKMYSCEIDSEDYVYQKLMGMSKAEYEKKLIEEEKKYARKIEFHGRTLDECVNALLKFKNRGESVCVDFNGHQLYSCDVTMDSAYLEVCGQTKADFDRAQEEWRENYRKEQEEAKAKAEAKIPDWIKRGEGFIYPERAEEWKKCVEARASDLYHGMDLDAAIEIMEKLKSGATLDEAKELLDSQDHSGASYGMVRNIIFSFSKQGPEFWEHTAYGEISPENKMAIADKKKENAELDELHRDDSTKEVPAERRTEEQEISDSSAEKEQLTAEISDIEQQLQALKAKEAEFKKALGDKQSQLNGLEEK